MIEADSLSKRYGDKLAVDSLSFAARPGVVTGFLGPNGSGTSTTMRMIMAWDRPPAGSARINGRPYERNKAPLHEVGALLEAKAIHPGRSACNRLRALAASNGIGKRQVLEVIDMVGLTEVARKRAGGSSLGMGQRQGIASALLGDPRVVMLDEPVNGLHPEGVLWIRNLLKSVAAQGRTVFVSSRLMSEMALIAEDLAQASGRSVRVRSPHAVQLRDLLLGDGVTITSCEPGGLAAVLGAFLVGQAILSSRGMNSVALGDPGVLRAVAGSAVYLTGAGLIGLAVGALLRNTAAAITTVVGALFLLPGVFALLPRSWNENVGPYLPSNAASAFVSVTSTDGSQSTWSGLAVFAGYVAVLLPAAAGLLKLRDA